MDNELVSAFYVVWYFLKSSFQSYYLGKLNMLEKGNTTSRLDDVFLRSQISEFDFSCGIICILLHVGLPYSVMYCRTYTRAAPRFQ